MKKDNILQVSANVVTPLIHENEKKHHEEKGKGREGRSWLGCAEYELLHKTELGARGGHGSRCVCGGSCPLVVNT